MTTTTEQLRDGTYNLRDLARAAANDFPEDGLAQWAGYFGIDVETDNDPDTIADVDDLRDRVRGAHEEGILSIDREVVVSVVYGTGGPHHEVAITFQSGDAIRGEVRGYWGGDEVVASLNSDEVEAYVEALGLTEESGL